MNVLRHPSLQRQTHVFYKRALSTATPYVPPASLQNVRNREVQKMKPPSPGFFSGRQGYYDAIESLETAAYHSQNALRRLNLFPLPDHAKESLPYHYTMWQSKKKLAETVGSTLSTARYRRFIALLNNLNLYRRIAEAGGYGTMRKAITDVIEAFEIANKSAVLARRRRKAVLLDEYGRSYTLGKRKESAARVWIIPVKQPAPPSSSKSEIGFSPPAADAEIVTGTTILVNNLPLVEYFPIPSHREKVVRPFKLTGLLGAYNVFALVRGGGNGGQAGAMAHGIAKGLIAHVPDVGNILRKSKLARRDPRMVERKKTNRAKARKAYTWTKR